MVGVRRRRRRRQVEIWKTVAVERAVVRAGRTIGVLLVSSCSNRVKFSANSDRHGRGSSEKAQNHRGKDGKTKKKEREREISVQHSQFFCLKKSNKQTDKTMTYKQIKITLLHLNS